ncbi:universal stress protein [Mucilaginibacter sp. BT774]|uniref:universal stress protein n=1 Tax=Mucilaginibacter sp. BT774 TaxID=3062276 RepID=UPI00267556AC|nr:universal stress protein [Mucilaginibacter sp. BT774]MDO3628236.1 universal stress protein [Mucilaginibacter sp. BT774]
MKTILILTDFSKNATHAALAGIRLAKDLHANIFLFHSNTNQALTPIYAGGPTVVDEVNLMEDENREKLKALADLLQPFIEEGEGAWQPSLHYNEGLGELSYQLRNILATKDIEIIVMGAREGSRLDHFFTGSETFSVIDHANKPVLVVPQNIDLVNLKRVLFATDFAEEDIRAIRYLAGLGSVFNYHIEIVHINSYGDDDITKELRKLEFMKHIERLRYSLINNAELNGKDVVNRLNRLCEETKPDMLAFTHYRDSFFARLLHQSISHEALENQKVPMLIFPAKFTL